MERVGEECSRWLQRSDCLCVRDTGDERACAVQVVRKKGVEPEWEGPGIATRDKGLIYVLDNFDCPDFKLLLGECRYIHTSPHQRKFYRIVLLGTDM